MCAYYILSSKRQPRKPCNQICDWARYKFHYKTQREKHRAVCMEVDTEARTQAVQHHPNPGEVGL